MSMIITSNPTPYSKRSADVQIDIEFENEYEKRNPILQTLCDLCAILCVLCVKKPFPTSPLQAPKVRHIPALIRYHPIDILAINN